MTDKMKDNLPFYGLSTVVNATKKEVQRAYELWFEYYQENAGEQPALSEFENAQSFGEHAQRNLFRFIDAAQVEFREIT